MSSINSEVQYSYSLDVYNNVNGTQGSFVLLGESGIDDATALAILAALRGVPMPAGVTADFSLSKSSNVSTNYEPDLDSFPPSFI